MSSAGKLLFLIGLGAAYRVRLIGQIGVSEILVFMWAPFLFINELPHLRRNGFAGYLTVWFLALLGCVVSSVVNHTALPLFLRGFAQIYSLFAGVVVIHSLLRKDPQAIKWLALGLGLSPLLTFLSHGGNLDFDFDMEVGGMEAFGRMATIAKLVRIPVAGWYFNMPLWCSSALPFVFGAFCLARSASGRSLSLTLMGTGLLAFLGRKNCEKIRGISKHFMQFFLGVLLFLFLFKVGYTYMAPRGYLGSATQKKFQFQTRGNTGTLALLIGGRVQFFSGTYVVLKKPIWGFGPWAFDRDGLLGGFYEKYATEDEYIRYLRGERRRMAEAKPKLLDGHSHLITFWIWFGIFGLIFWIYVVMQIFKMFMKSMGHMPLFFGFVCAYAPAIMWDIFFSPFGQRLQTAAFVTVVILMNNEKRFFAPHR